MISYVILILYLTAAVLNLAGTRKGKSRLFMATKPTLLLLVCLYCYSRSADSPDLLLIGAFLACWLGDVLLMLRGTGWFITGGASFLTGHFLLIFIFTRSVDFGRLPVIPIIFASLSYSVLACVIMLRSRKNAPGAMLIPILLYLLCNGAMNVFALVRLIEYPGVWQAVSYAGALLFFLSDCVLFLVRYDTEEKRFYKTHFCVMLTYISGVMLIALGLAPPV